MTEENKKVGVFEARGKFHSATSQMIVTAPRNFGHLNDCRRRLDMEAGMDELTHKVEITISGNYPHGNKQHAMVSLSGNGGLDHMIEAFKAALIAAGFSIGTAKKLDELDV